MKELIFFSILKGKELWGRIIYVPITTSKPVISGCRRLQLTDSQQLTYPVLLFSE